MNGFRSHVSYESHWNDCKNFKAQSVSPPDKSKSVMKFSKDRAKLKPWFVMYCDMESYLVNENEDECDQSMTDSSTRVVRHHRPFAYGYTVVDFKGDTVVKCKAKYAKEGEHTGEKFLRDVDQLYRNVLSPLMVDRDVIMTHVDEINHKKAKRCQQCKKRFLSTTKRRKVIHHDHKDGQFLGSLCSFCNTKIVQSKRLYCLFHNSMNYDSHELILGIARVAEPKDYINIIPHNKEKYIGIQWNDIIFLDSIKFLNSSLDKLAQNLDDKALKYLSEHLPNDERREVRLSLLRKKGVFPYNYFQNKSVLKEKELPPKSSFYDELHKTDISDDDYQHACMVWKEFKCRTLKDYCSIYLSTDVLLLACAFEAFRFQIFSCYKLEPCMFYTLPGLALEAALLMTDVKIELMTDMNMILMIEKGILGGISCCSNRYARANNRQVGNFDDTKPETYISFADSNNLYGYVQAGNLPIGEYSWMTKNELKHVDVMGLEDGDSTGFIFEADLFVPHDAKLHEKLADFPPAPVRRRVDESELSSWQRSNRIENVPSHEKLILDLHDKSDYVLCGRTLRLYAELGLTYKLNRGIKFKQSPWLKPFIDFNTKKRSETNVKFEQDIWKLCNNSTFGKWIENQRNKRKIKLVHTKEGFLKKCSKPNFKDFTVFSKNLVAVEMANTHVEMDRPTVVGFSVLCLAKRYMYDLWYNKVRPMFGGKVRLCYCDTDSFILYAKTRDLYESYKPYANDVFDFSNLDPSHQLYSSANAMQYGLLKDEAQGHLITEFIGLKSKMYYLHILNKPKKVGKGINRGVLAREINRDLNYDALFKPQSTKHRVMFQRIATDGTHGLVTLSQVKLGLNCYDDKRKIMRNGIDSIPYGYQGSRKKLRLSNWF